jgi:hypothetical protein
MNPCPECGRPAAAEATTCAVCGHALANGVAPQRKKTAENPPPPPEVSGWVIHKPSPEMIAEALQTFDEQAFLADVREIEQTGGVKFEDFIGAIEETVKRRD